MSDAVKVNKIVLDIGDKEITLTMEQAKKLKDLLADLFGKEVIKEVHHHHEYWWKYYPQVTWDTGKFQSDPNIVYCKALSYDANKESLRVDFSALNMPS